LFRSNIERGIVGAASTCDVCVGGGGGLSVNV
jgi:hypothetical protein